MSRTHRAYPAVRDRRLRKLYEEQGGPIYYRAAHLGRDGGYSCAIAGPDTDHPRGYSFANEFNCAHGQKGKRYAKRRASRIVRCRAQRLIDMGIFDRDDESDLRIS